MFFYLNPTEIGTSRSQNTDVKHGYHVKYHSASFDTKRCRHVWAPRPLAARRPPLSRLNVILRRVFVMRPDAMRLKGKSESRCRRRTISRIFSGHLAKCLRPSRSPEDVGCPLFSFSQQITDNCFSMRTEALCVAWRANPFVFFHDQTPVPRPKIVPAVAIKEPGLGRTSWVVLRTLGDAPGIWGFENTVSPGREVGTAQGLN